MIKKTIEYFQNGKQLKVLRERLKRYEKYSLQIDIGEKCYYLNGEKVSYICTVLSLLTKVDGNDYYLLQKDNGEKVIKPVNCVFTING